jgi:type II secretory pathway pseudopilin PulG
MTFYELTVVFIIVAILVALAFLATRRLTVETELARVREEQRVISRALQNYFVDQYDFPRQSQGLTVLSEPVTYLASIPQDIFARGEEKGQPYAYRTWDNEVLTVWLLVSRGPDGDLDFDETVSQGTFPGLSASNFPNLDTLPTLLLQLSYDPTNGLHSNGDVFTLSPYIRN